MVPCCGARQGHRRRAGADVPAALRATGGSANHTLTICCGSRSGSCATTASPTRTWRALRCCTTRSRSHAAGIAPGGDGRRAGGAGRAVRRAHRRPGRRGHQPRTGSPAATSTSSTASTSSPACAASPWARVIKASDFTDNAVGIIHTTGPKLPGSPASTARWCRRCASSSCARTPRWRPTSRA